MQVNGRLNARCRVEFSPGGPTKATLAASGQPPVLNLTSSFAATRDLCSPLPTRSPAATGGRHLLQQALHNLCGKGIDCRGGVAVASIQAVAAASSFFCHPAVVDSSMHIGILLGQKDGKIRIPGAENNCPELCSEEVKKPAHPVFILWSASASEL